MVYEGKHFMDYHHPNLKGRRGDRTLNNATLDKREKSHG